MPEKQNRRTRITRLLLRTALIELMQIKPFEKISIKDICEQADLNRTTFYLHYTDQHALLQDIQEEVKNNLYLFQKQDHDGKEVLDSITVYLSYVKDNYKVFQVLLNQTGSSDFRKDLLAFTSRIFWPEQNDAIIQDHYARRYLLSGCIGVLSEWLERSFDLPLDEMAVYIHELAEGTIMSMKTPSAIR